MAAAYRVVDRLHPPLTAPLEDICASTAHLKVHWPTSFQKLQEVTLENKDYSNAKPHGSKRGTDDLIVLNIYKTNDLSPSWGLGPSPLSPLYIFYPALHPADRTLPKPINITTTTTNTNTTNTTRPSLLQYFLDRKDFCTHSSTTMACVRFLEEFVEWRLIPTRTSTPLLEKMKLRKPTTAPTPHRKDTHAATVFLTPTIRTVDFGEASKTMVNLFTSLPHEEEGEEVGEEVGMTMYTTVQEVEGWKGVMVFYSQGERGGKKMYWWIVENSSWRCVYDPVDKSGVGKVVKVDVGERKETVEVSRFGEGRVKRGGVVKVEERKGVKITCGTVKLYGSNQLEPVAEVELGTGQMWVVKSIVIETIDVAVAVMFAVVNLEMGIQGEHEMLAGSGKEGKFIRRSF